MDQARILCYKWNIKFEYYMGSSSQRARSLVPRLNKTGRSRRSQRDVTGNGTPSGMGMFTEFISDWA